MSCPDYLNLESFIPMLRLIYDQCLCCFRYNPEVWAAYGLFEAQEVPRRSIELQQMQLQQQVCVGDVQYKNMCCILFLILISIVIVVYIVYVSIVCKLMKLCFLCILQLDSTATDEIKKSAIAGARRVYLAGIYANPAVTLLRCALAELEETSGMYMYLCIF